jgi:hypothetical protein
MIGKYAQGILSSFPFQDFESCLIKDFNGNESEEELNQLVNWESICRLINVLI